jgi:formate dehydrogenase subunit gamma
MESEPRVLKHALSSRLLHWGLIFGFLPAAITGFIVWLKPGSEDFVNLAMHIHIVGAAILTVSVVLFTVFAFDRVIAFITHSFKWDRNDLDWFIVMVVQGGYAKKILLRKDVEIPPAGKVNAGQKLFSILLLFGGTFLIFSGWILWTFIPVVPKVFIYWLNTGHIVFAVLIGLFLCVHIFLGLYFTEEFKAMFTDGTQPLSVAEHQAPLWVKNDIEPVE